ncbi:glyoxalase [Streptomyces sp. NBC_00237]|uniref:glyoxalase n=1 Tax=Streptomyces sp. NBC_00237 TaxID=2975687 RepID=UPI0022545018|nr:glyoxalase [Streptomyces sp. NBC_00237]MCX5205634.1 glyoxalase [Streptomyces sp. NBC_00237]
MLTSFCPVICTSRIEESRAFYAELFGFRTTYETPWCVGLGRPGPSPHELVLLDHSHPALPQGQRLPLRAVRITVEVDGGERESQRTVTDPNGVRVDVVASRRLAGDRATG